MDVVEIRSDEKDDGGGGEKSWREGRGMRMMMMKGEGKGERDHLKDFLQGFAWFAGWALTLFRARSRQITWYAELEANYITREIM